MSRNAQRLHQLEKRLSPEGTGRSLIVIHRTTANGSAPTPPRYESSDGKHTWVRETGESAADFERRFSRDADCIAERGTVVVLPCNGR
jgi:hypothetical protein